MNSLEINLFDKIQCNISTMFEKAVTLDFDGFIYCIVKVIKSEGLGSEFGSYLIEKFGKKL